MLKISNVVRDLWKTISKFVVSQIGNEKSPIQKRSTFVCLSHRYIFLPHIRVIYFFTDSFILLVLLST